MPKDETRQQRTEWQAPARSREGMSAHREQVACDLWHSGIRMQTCGGRNGLAPSAGGYVSGKIALELGQIMAGLAAVLIIPTGQHLTANILNSSRYDRIGTLDGQRGVETEASCQEG
jgi:hypothetical protein